MELKDLVRIMTKEEFESAINEDIKFVERFKHFFKHDDVARIIEHVKSVLEASVDYCYPNHPEPKAEPGDMGEVSDGYHTFNELYRYRMLYNNKIFFVYGRRKSGSFNIRDFNGENSKDVSRKKFKLIRGKRHPIILK